jgi:hypothetical protein
MRSSYKSKARREKTETYGLWDMSGAHASWRGVSNSGGWQTTNRGLEYMIGTTHETFNDRCEHFRNVP